MNPKHCFLGHLTSLVLFLSLIGNSSKAQSTWDALTWKCYADYKLQMLNKSYVGTGILYDRVFPIANVDEYTGLANDTTTPNHFMQAYYEIYNSAYNTADWKLPGWMVFVLRGH